MNIRWWYVCGALMVSLAIHGGVDLILQDEEDPVQVAGSNVEIAILGNAEANMSTQGDEVEAEVAAAQPPAAMQPAAQVLARPVIAEDQLEAVQPPTQAAKAAPTPMAAALPTSQSENTIIAAAAEDSPVAEQISDVEAIEPSETKAAEPRPTAANARQQEIQRQQSQQSETQTQRPADSQHPVAAQTDAAQRSADAAPETPPIAVVSELTSETLDAAVGRQITVAEPVETQRETKQPSNVAPVQTPQVETAQEIDQPEIKPVETATLIRPLDPVAVPKPKPVQEQRERSVQEKERPVQKKRQQTNKGNRGSRKQDTVEGRTTGDRSGARNSEGEKRGKRAGEQGSFNTSNYEGKVRRKVIRAARYPKNALSKRLTGTSLLRFRVNANGSLTVVGIARSSGSAILDSAALAAAKRASPFPKIPAAARTRSWTFYIPVTFKPR